MHSTHCQSRLPQFIGENVVKNYLSNSISLLPNRPLKVGDTWKGEGNASQAKGAELSQDFVLTFFDEQTIKISSTGKMKLDSSINSALGANLPLAAISGLEGSQKGTYEIDQRTRFLKSLRETSTIEGNLDLRGKSIPIQIQTLKTIGIKKID